MGLTHPDDDDGVSRGSDGEVRGESEEAIRDLKAELRDEISHLKSTYALKVEVSDSDATLKADIDALEDQCNSVTKELDHVKEIASFHHKTELFVSELRTNLSHYMEHADGVYAKKKDMSSLDARISDDIIKVQRGYSRLMEEVDDLKHAKEEESDSKRKEVKPLSLTEVYVQTKM